MYLGDGNEKGGGGEGGRRRGEVGGFELLGDVVLLSLFFLMMICTASLVHHFVFSTLFACRYVSTEKPVSKKWRLFMSGSFCVPIHIKLNTLLSSAVRDHRKSHILMQKETALNVT